MWRLEEQLKVIKIESSGGRASSIFAQGSTSDHVSPK